MKFVIPMAALLIATTASAMSPRYPQTVKLDGEPTAAETTAVRSVLGRSFGKEWSDYEKTKGQRITFTVGHADLNGDGRPDLLIFLSDRGFGYCGSAGCAGYAILATQQGYAATEIDLATFYQEVTVLPTTHKGLHDLRCGNGHKIFRWNGKEYL